MQRPFGLLGTSASCRTLLGSTCVLGETERAEELGQQVRRQQDIHAPRWERRHFGDEGVGLVLELGRALAGVHGELQELSAREVGQARQQAHETGGNGRGVVAIWKAMPGGTSPARRPWGKRVDNQMGEKQHD
eukprot:scaffold15942_cov74-Phaeocystis_antarctica.AAC.3